MRTTGFECAACAWATMLTGRQHLLLACGALLLLAGGPTTAAEPADASIDFARDIGPIFVEHCYECHGPDTQESGLRLDERDAALAGGDSGPMLVAGKSAESELIRRVTAEDDERMPPPDDNNKPLSEAQIAKLRAWIDSGATWPQDAVAGSSLWSFQPIVRPEPPEVQDTAWVRNPIDRFVLARLEAKGLKPSPEADRFTLIKRLSYDLLGLPPDVNEVEAFVADESADAYERLVDRLLDSPHFGERWGRHWLDMARYADSDGYEKDNSRPDAWRYRDWVIKAINDDMPLDRFTIEQMAGDLLPGATPSDRLATAFHRQTLTNTEGGTDKEQWRVEAIFDRIATTGAVWLGLTVGCAQCHSHKYDPISQQDYYELFAFFNNGDEVMADVPLVGEELIKWNREKRQAEEQLAKLAPVVEQTRRQWIAELPAWEAKLKEKPAVSLAYHPVELISAKSKAGADIKILSDGSYLVTGKNPNTDTVTITARMDLPQATGFRIEALAHDSLGGRGPGRTDHGNFVLSEIQVSAADKPKFGKDHAVALIRAEADVAQDNFSAAAAIDGNTETGWAIGGNTGKDHSITVMAKQPIHGDATPHLQLVLTQNHGSKHTLGRFRVMAVSGDDPLLGIPNNVRDVLAIPSDKRTPEQSKTVLDYYLSRDKKLAELTADAEKLRARVAAKPVMKARVITERTKDRRMTHILHRGDFLQPEKEVQPATLTALPKIEPRGEVPDRLDLAYWLVDPANRLVPRVTANHLWENLFGRGIVRTVGDFGVRGELPTHPQLLDWLATQLERRGHSRKEMIRLIVSSATYRQSSATRPELVEIDPTNDLFHRQNRYRVEAEIVRDLALAVGGLLSPKLGGPSVFPPLPPGIAELSYANNFKWKTSEGEDRYRRGMYTYFKRTAPHPNLTTFDCPDSNTTCLKRQTSNTPLQALALLNNDVFAEAARALGRRILSSGGENDTQRLTSGLRWCIARPPSSDELASLAELLASARQWYAEHEEAAKTAVGGYQPEGMPVAEAAAWVATARILLNLDEFLTRE